MDILSKLQAVADPFRVWKGGGFHLNHYDPQDTGRFGSESRGVAKELFDQCVIRLSQLQEKLYAQNTWAVLLVFQAMDAAGKDSTIKHVMSGINPQGCRVHSFKAPSTEELSHDFLWRVNQRLPARGEIGIFNRSYYEEVLVVRVHPELLKRQELPPQLITDRIWKERYEGINDWERHLSRSGVVIRKFFLNLSKDEQKQRFLERLNDPTKKWKFQAGDLHERRHWNDYMQAYESMIRATAKRHAPWYVVPADHKWFARLVVVSAIVDALEELDLQFPTMPPQAAKALAAARRHLERE